MEDDVIFIKQVLVHPRDQLEQATKNKDEVTFIKQVPPVHPRDKENNKDIKISKR